VSSCGIGWWVVGLATHLGSAGYHSGSVQQSTRASTKVIGPNLSVVSHFAQAQLGLRQSVWLTSSWAIKLQSQA